MRIEPFDQHCRRCKRLAQHLDAVKSACPEYYAAPVPSFGEPDAALLVVGLAPGMHGANRTGRPFTGDHAGIILYETLHRHGFCNRSRGDRVDDGLRLLGARITNAVRCLPPQNKPLAAEIRECRTFLAHELSQMPDGGVIVALGRIAHDSVLAAAGERAAAFTFGHGREHVLGKLILLDSYHCSRYNTQTRRLTPAMFDAVFSRARALCDAT